MRRILLVAALFLVACGQARAGSSPGLVNGQVPTAAQWNSYFAAKYDDPGYITLNKAGDVMTGRLVTAPSGASTSGLNITPGSAPGSPANGDVWMTASGFFAQINGSTVQIASSPFTGPLTVVSNSANALAVGPNGATNPSFNVDASTASAATGINVKSAAAGGGAALSVVSSGTNEALSINAKGSGGISIGSVSTGNVTIGSGSAAVILPGAGANSLSVGPNGTTNPTLNVDDSTASAATGLNVKSAAAGGGVALSAISSGTNEGMSVSAKGSGVLTLNGSGATGTVDVGAGGGGLTVHGSLTATGLVTYADMATAAIATGAQYLAGTASLLVNSGTIYQAETTTTFGATTTFDFSTFINTAVTLTGNITTMTLSNVTAGKSGSIRFIQDGSGSRTSVWNSVFKFSGGTTPVLTTTPNAIDVLFYDCVSATLCYASLNLNMK